MVLNFLSNSVHYTKKGGKITINLVLVEEQIIKPKLSNATQELVDLEDLQMSRQMLGLGEFVEQEVNGKNETYASGGLKVENNNSLKNILRESLGNKSLNDNADKLKIDRSLGAEQL